MKKQETKSKAGETCTPACGPAVKSAPKWITDRDFYDRIFALHGAVRNEMRRRQIAGLQWRSLHPTEQQLFIILQRLKMFISRDVKVS